MKNFNPLNFFENEYLINFKKFLIETYFYPLGNLKKIDSASEIFEKFLKLLNKIKLFSIVFENNHITFENNQKLLKNFISFSKSIKNLIFFEKVLIDFESALIFSKTFECFQKRIEKNQLSFDFFRICVILP